MFARQKRRGHGARLVLMSFLTSLIARATLRRMANAFAKTFLLESQNADGGWGYRAGGISYVEPTAVVMLALADRNAEPARLRALGLVLSLQHADGGWGIAAVDPESGWMTAYAVYALAAFQDARAALARGVDWLVRTEGLSIAEPTARENVRSMYHMDAALRGWPWQPGDAGWVHPTALAIIALIATGNGNHPRVQAGVEFLLDRAVASGGWNIGNPEMLGKPVPPTPQDTAVALIALNRSRVSPADPRVQGGLRFLADVATRSGSPADLAWAIDGLHHWNVDVNSVCARLADLQLADGSWQGNPLTTAIAMRVGVG